ncbi:MAG: ribosome biogenesis GTPase Der [Aeriscardovia sp.]|nr:ribosome biogenesis GTPase Der [Aeriscardovia sp.]
MIIAIDGPAGVGKSTVSKMLAEKYGLVYLNTGSVYRAACLYSMEAGAEGKEGKIRATLSLFDGRLSLAGGGSEVLIDGRDVSSELRKKEIGENISAFSSIKEIRDILNHFFRRQIAEAQKVHRGVVLEGRDATTAIALKADLRLLLTASKAVRRERRRGEGIEDDVSSRDESDLLTTNFLTPAPGVIEIDTTHMDADQVFSLICSMIDRDNLVDEGEGEERREAEKEAGETALNIAIVGRPNVGKSTLANRICGTRRSIISDLPNATRDRVVQRTEWRGKKLDIVDTAGWNEGPGEIAERTLQQTQMAIERADAVIFEVDAASPLTTLDRQIASLLRRSAVPTVLAVNKADSSLQEAAAGEGWKLGLGEPVPISALHGRGVGDLLDLVLEKAKGGRKRDGGEDLPKLAIVGRPNVGKSTLLNRLSGEERAVVSGEAGTTRDSVDEVAEIGGKPWLLIDTAGISRRPNMSEGIEYYSFIRSQNAIDRAEVCLVLLDALRPLSKQDLKVINRVEEAGKGLVIVLNKWDGADGEQKARIEDGEGALPYWARKIRASAMTGWHVQKIAPAVEEALSSRSKRIPTHQLNQFISSFQISHPHPLRSGKQPRILFAVQAAQVPPQFILFVNYPLDASYLRHFERQLRSQYGFEGSPISFKQKIREKKA